MKTQINQNIFNGFPSLESKRLLLREMLPGDNKDILLLRSDDEVMRFMDTNKMASLNDADKFIAVITESFKNKTGINWAVVEKDSNNFLGYLGLWRIIPEHCRAEIGYVLNPGYWNKGFMTEAMRVVIKYGFDEINLHSIEANVNPQNKSSIKLLEKLGFVKEAYFRENFLFDGKFLDSVIYSLLVKDY